MLIYVGPILLRGFCRHIYILEKKNKQALKGSLFYSRRIVSLNAVLGCVVLSSLLGEERRHVSRLYSLSADRMIS
jgi:hypothetical protein